MALTLKKGSVRLIADGPDGLRALVMVLDGTDRDLCVCELTGHVDDFGLIWKVPRTAILAGPDFESATLLKCGGRIVPVQRLYGTTVRVLDGFELAGVRDTSDMPVGFEVERDTPVKTVVSKYRGLLDDCRPNLLVDPFTHEPLTKDAVQVCDDSVYPSQQFVANRDSLVDCVRATICQKFCGGVGCQLPTMEAINFHLKRHPIKHPIGAECMDNAHAVEVSLYMKNAIAAHASDAVTESSRKATELLGVYMEGFWADNSKDSAPAHHDSVYSPTSPEYRPSSPEHGPEDSRRVRPRYA